MRFAHLLPTQFPMLFLFHYIAHWIGAIPLGALDPARKRLVGVVVEVQLLVLDGVVRAPLMRVRKMSLRKEMKMKAYISTACASR
jgi:hypothetical protein